MEEKVNLRAINCGSGQRPFASTPQIQWVNVDSQERWNPDIVCDASDLPQANETVDYVVLHHILEHFGCGEGWGLIAEAYRVLKPGGSLLVFVPDLRALAQRWLAGGLTTQIYVTNLYGAYMGDEADRHKWGFDRESLELFLGSMRWSWMGAFDWRDIPGSSLARDFWIIGMECKK
jgi:SAM-dependent methyltransferase